MTLSALDDLQNWYDMFYRLGIELPPLQSLIRDIKIDKQIESIPDPEMQKGLWKWFDERLRDDIPYLERFVLKKMPRIKTVLQLMVSGESTQYDADAVWSRLRHRLHNLDYLFTNYMSVWMDVYMIARMLREFAISLIPGDINDPIHNVVAYVGDAHAVWIRDFFVDFLGAKARRVTRESSRCLDIRSFKRPFFAAYDTIMKKQLRSTNSMGGGITARKWFVSSAEQEQALIGHLRSVFIDKSVLPDSIALPDSVAYWKTIYAGVFVTGYKRRHSYSSENVWCCMSNGEYDGKQDVFTNAMESARICFTQDSRRTANLPAELEVSILAPRSTWSFIPYPYSKMSVSRKKSIQVRVHDGGMGGKGHWHSAIYLPSVWNERPEWTAADLIRNLVSKALSGGPPTMDVNNANIQVYEIDTYDIHEQQNGGGGIEQSSNSSVSNSILEAAWPFYMNFAKDGKILAYIVSLSNGLNLPSPSYDNSGAWVRSYSDVAAFWKLTAYLARMKRLTDPDIITDVWETFVSHAKEEFPSEHQESARLMFLIDIGESKNEMDLVHTLIGEKKYVDRSDTSFAAPQAMLALARSQGHDLPNEVYVEFFNLYIVQREAEKAVLRYSAFAANWILQAFAECLTHLSHEMHARLSQSIMHVARMILIPACENAIQKNASITEVACAFHGLLAFRKYIHMNKKREYQKWLSSTLRQWRVYQQEWNMSGGFRYYVDQPWYRTDVTSHVVEVILLASQGGFSGNDGGGCDVGGCKEMVDVRTTTTTTTTSTADKKPNPVHMHMYVVRVMPKTRTHPHYGRGSPLCYRFYDRMPNGMWELLPETITRFPIPYEEMMVLWMSDAKEAQDHPMIVTRLEGGGPNAKGDWTLLKMDQESHTLTIRSDFNSRDSRDSRDSSDDDHTYIECSKHPFMGIIFT